MNAQIHTAAVTAMEKKWTLLRMKICGIYIWKKKCNKISLISQCASLLSDGFSTSFTPWHQSPSRLHCIYVANQVLYLAKGGRRDSCSVSCIVQAVWMWWDLPTAWDSTLEWDRRACLSGETKSWWVLVLEFNIKKKGSFLSTLISLCGIIPLWQIHGIALST